MYANPSNTACSNDRLVNGQMLLQWFGPPGPRNMIDRHHRTVAPLYKNGRLFIPGDNRVIAADAYNGTPLWNVAIPNSRRAGAFRDCSYMVAADDNVYVAAADKCLKLNAATGKLDSSFAVPTTAKSKAQEWGFLATVDDLLFGTTQNKGASRRDHSLAQIHDGIYWDSRPLVCGNEFFTMNRQSGEVFWKYRPKSGVLINATITIDEGTVFLIESTNPETFKVGNGRVRLAELFKSPANLVALDIRTGSVIWTKPFDLSAIQHSVFMSHSNGKLVVVGSRNQGTDRKKGRVHYDVHVVDSKTGQLKWFKSQNQGTKFDGSHGEQDHHPVIVGNKLYCEPHAYNLDTGQPLKNWRWQPAHRRGCGTISASSQTLFFRQSNPTMFDLNANTYSKVTSTTRPGCWINMIPAGGLLLVPDASSGCTCNYAIQTSMAFLPVIKTKENAK
jgi:outer membrane protein assembly factor BamB